MRKTGMRIGLLALGLSVLLASFAPQVKAQDEGEKTTPVTIVPVKNVRAEMMAYWLNWEKQGVTTPIIKDKNGGTASSGTLDLIDFPGIESITADAAKNELLVLGTPESVRKLKMIVEFLDRPVRNAEIKAQFVEVDAAEIAGLGIVEETDSKVKTMSLDGKNTVTYGQTFRDKLRALVENKRAAVIQSAQITATNNFTSEVSWNTYPTLASTKLQFTPTIQNDDTVTLYISLPIKESTPLPEKMPSFYLSTIANVKNADVIVLPTKQTAINGRAIFLLVSAHVVQDQIALLD